MADQLKFGSRLITKAIKNDSYSYILLPRAPDPVQPPPHAPVESTHQRHHHVLSWFNFPKLTSLVPGILSLVFLTANLLSIHGGLQTRTLDRKPIDLSFPLRKGTYVVGQGGSNITTNHHVALLPQSYALDIVKVNPWGLRAQGLLPLDLPRYYIYGEPLYAPCAGQVLAASDGLKDQPPPERSPISIPGNLIIIFCKDLDASILMAHLKAGSLVVKPGDEVQVSQMIASVGNTGNTTEPHLHIQAIRGSQDNFQPFMEGGEPLPIHWSGRFLVRNDVFEVP